MRFTLSTACAVFGLSVLGVLGQMAGLTMQWVLTAAVVLALLVLPLVALLELVGLFAGITGIGWRAKK